MVRHGRKGVDLFIDREIEQSALDSLAGNAQATLRATVIENVSTNENYGSGSIKGLRANFAVKPEAAIEFPPRITMMVLPAGMTVPTVITAGNRKQQERFCWGDKVLQTNGATPATDNLWEAELHLKTARRFHEGDLLTSVLVNEDPNIAFGAAAVGYVFLKAYVSSD